MTLDEPRKTDRLLLVDDNPTNLQVLFQALEDEGYELLVAQSGSEAITTAKAARPQLILLDINMPGIDGYETCRRLKADPATRDTVIIFLSARGDTADKVRGLDLGAVDYIGKPFQFEEVVARVRQHLQTYHQHQQLRQHANQLEQQVAGGFPNLTHADLETLVASGEGATVEFKSTLRKNLHTNKIDKRMERACLKTIAAYLNTNGGCLLVGVDDAGQPLGLEADEFDNDDKLLLHWNGLIKNTIGVQFTQFVRSSVRDFHGKRILLVQCLPAKEPIFFRRDNEEHFYIRTGNGTQPLRPSQILVYLTQRETEPQPTAMFFAKTGQRLGQYAIDEKLGAGATGVVYRAHHAMLNRPVAIKMLDPNRTNDRSVSRFEREVQLTSQLNHPNTIAIYDYGRTTEGVFYYVMEYLDGIALDDLIREYGPQRDGRVINTFMQICGALAEAHEVGLVHRDIKPANMMLNRRGGMFDVAKLLDFGLVKALDASREAVLTEPGSIAGTPLYLSPEAIEHPEQIDPRSDIYSLAAAAYHLLTGTPVFTGSNIVEICKQHIQAQPEPPIGVDGVPIDEDLAKLILTCLSKEPARRPQTAHAVRDALADCNAFASWTQCDAAHWWEERESEGVMGRMGEGG